MIIDKNRPVAYATGASEVSKLFSQFANTLRSSVSIGAISARSAALILAAAAPLTLSSTSASAACIETAPGSGIFACTGINLATLSPASAVGGDLVVTTVAPFSVIVGAGFALDIDNAPGDGSISFTDNNASTVVTSSNTRALEVDNLGMGATTIVLSGTYTALDNDAVDVFTDVNATSLSVTINAGSVLSGYEHGLYIQHRGSGAAMVTIDGALSSIDDYEALIYSDTSAAGAVTILVGETGSLTTLDDDGLDASGSGNGDLKIIFNGMIDAGGTGISSNKSGTGNLIVMAGANSVIEASSTGIGTSMSGTGTTTIVADGMINAGYNGIGAYGSLTAGDINITTGADSSISSAYSYGIYTYQSGPGAINITTGAGSSIAAAHGISAGHDGIGAINITTGAASSIASNSEGIFASHLDSGAINITTGAGSSIASSGSFGIYAVHSGSEAINITTGAGSSITADLEGIYAIHGGVGPVTINAGGMITAQGYGIFAVGNASSPIVINVSGVITGGTAGFFGIKTITGAMGMTTLTLNSGAVVSATSGDAISNDAGDSTTTVNTGASVLGTINLGDGSDNLIFAGGDFSGVTLFDGGDDMSPADTFIDTLTFAGSNGAVTGANVVNFEKVVIGAGSTISFSDNMLTTGELMTSAGGTLSATGGTLMITANVINDGTISAQDGVANDRVEVSGNYSGSGTLAVDVNLATNKSDVLAVAGNATGATTITANYLSPTSANGANILVVDVTGTSSAGGFALGNPVSGAFAYDLSQIGADWFLRQTGFNPATPTYEAYPQVLSNLNQLSSLQQRTANRKSVSSGSSTSAALGYAQATKKRKEFAQFDNDISATEKPFIWGRIEGSKSTVDSSVSTTGSSFDTNRWALHVGIDSQLPINSAGQLFLGINTNLGGANTDVTSATGNGSINTESYGFGFSATWFANSGFYVDGQAQATWFTSDLNNVANGALINNNSGRGVAFSIEVGKGFEMGNGWIFTPQAQLMTSSINFDNFTGPNGELVSLGDENSVTGRLGARIEHKGAWGSSGGSQSTIYALANVYSKFSGESRVTVTGVNFNSRPDEWTGEIGVGGSVDVGSFANGGHVSLYGQGTVGTSLTNFGDSNQYGALAGVKLRF